MTIGTHSVEVGHSLDSIDILATDWEIIEEPQEVVCDITAKCPKCGNVVHFLDAEEYEIINCVCGNKFKPVKPTKENE
ncbi:MAG: hypothetical protein PHH48_07810 [Eubacteriales bacterium]|nr:hypothetical protein [Eubacteriales bacterium]